MPRDGRINRAKILSAAHAEFLEHGFKQTSIRVIAQRAGVTSAALYRHFESKEAIYEELVRPGLDAVDKWMDQHAAQAYEGMRKGEVEDVASRSMIDMMRDVVFPLRSSFKLLLCSAQGTRYENFVHDLVECRQVDLVNGIAWMREHGYNTMDVNEETAHMLLSAFVTALFEPIAHDYPDESAERYLQVLERFFIPGWHVVLGV